MEQAQEARRKFAAGSRISDLMREYGVSRMVMSDIVHGMTYRD